MIVTKKLEDAPIMESAHNVDARNLYSTEDAMVSVITLKPGQELKKHITPVDVAFYVLKGTGVVRIGDEKVTVTENTLVESPKDILHCWYNESEGDLAFMVIKAPRPKKPTVFVA
ncbi:MAG: cupin domain-containing protein [Spirochaetales bacterium]|nr:cupin domain-containing protein [Spirochaetales bacterium]